jgi:hypothetical protein
MITDLEIDTLEMAFVKERRVTGGRELIVDCSSSFIY